MLNPQAISSNAAGEDSVVLKMTYDNTPFLFKGDVYGKRENTLAESVGYADILKVGNYGSSSGPAFLSRVKPGVSIIAADNAPQYNIPAEETIQDLKESVSKVHITCLNGTGKITSNGKTYSASSEK